MLPFRGYFKKQFSIINYRKVFAGDYVISVRSIPRLTLNFAGGIINYCGLRPTDLPSFEVAKLSGTNKKLRRVELNTSAGISEIE